MAEHTCVNTAPHVAMGFQVPPCPGCQEQFQKLYSKEREVLAAAVALAANDGHIDAVNAIITLGALVRVSREYSELCKQSPR